MPSKDEALRTAIAWIEQRADEPGYGYFCGGDPRKFSPDGESNSPEELGAHKAACEAWDRGETDAGREAVGRWYADGEGNAAHVQPAGFGLGSYSIRDPEADAVLATLRAALDAPEGSP